MIVVYLLFAIFGLILILTVIEIILLLHNKPAQELPDADEYDSCSCVVNEKKFEDLYHFLMHELETSAFSEDEVYSMLLKQSAYMSKRFDCSDFRAQLLFKIYKDCNDRLPECCLRLIKNTFLTFKYFMDEPGNDSMCYWSENHQILFAVSEYLAGQEWPDDIFSNNGMTGRQHMKKAEERINAWMSQRYLYGFSEYLSNNYIAEDLAPMANLIAYCHDENMVKQMKIIMDILWLDVALNSVNNRFVAVSSRMYGNNKAGNYYGNSIQAAMNVLWGDDGAAQVLSNPHLSATERERIQERLTVKPNHILLCFTDLVKKKKYILPQAIKDIALSRDCFAVKMGCGLSPEDMQKEMLIGQQPHQIMAQFGAETFTNPQVINNTLQYLKDNRMFRNSFVSYFKFLNLSILKPVRWDVFASKHNVMPHGIATGRGNVYTYRTAHYSMSTSVCKDVDMCGAQEHVWSANIGENLALFTTHPAGNGEGRYVSSPGYWIGNGRRPMSVQYESVNITVYKLPDKKRLGETKISKMTHAYFPIDFYDTFEEYDHVNFAKKDGVFVAMITNGKTSYKPFNADSVKGIYKNRTHGDKYSINSCFDLCCYDGQYHIYITELSDVDKESYDEFKQRILNNRVDFSDDGSATYDTYFGKIEVSYDGLYKLNNQILEKQFDRYDCKFCKVKRKADVVYVDSGTHSLLLDYNAIIRQSK